MTRISLLDTAHDAVRLSLNTGDIAVDATIGNGHDTVFLAQCVGETGHVFGFDIQAQALVNTRQRLTENGLVNRVTLFHGSHSQMQAYLPDKALGEIRAVMFNLGYLPGGDKSIITRTTSTVKALDAATQVLAEPGVITVLAYPGHTGGDQEAEVLAEWCARLKNPQFKVEIVLSRHDQPSAPQLFIIRKQADLL